MFLNPLMPTKKVKYSQRHRVYRLAGLFARHTKLSFYLPHLANLSGKKLAASFLSFWCCRVRHGSPFASASASASATTRAKPFFSLLHIRSSSPPFFLLSSALPSRPCRPDPAACGSRGENMDGGGEERVAPRPRPRPRPRPPSCACACAALRCVDDDGREEAKTKKDRRRRRKRRESWGLGRE